MHIDVYDKKIKFSTHAHVKIFIMQLTIKN